MRLAPNSILTSLVLVVCVGAALFLGSVMGSHNSLARALKAQAANELVLMLSEVSQLQSQPSLTSDALASLRSHGTAAETYLTALTLSDGRAQSYLSRLDAINADIAALTDGGRRSLEALRRNIEMLTKDLHR